MRGSSVQQKRACRTLVQVSPVHSRPVYERPGYGTLLSRIRANVRTYLRKQLELPRQEIAEIIRANLRAAVWFGLAAAFGMGSLVALVVLAVALVSLALPPWAAALAVFGVLAASAAVTGYG